MNRLLCLLFGCRGALRFDSRCSRCDRPILPEPWPDPPPAPNHGALAWEAAGFTKAPEGFFTRTPLKANTEAPDATCPTCGSGVDSRLLGLR